jgi:small subunit ribosomal protein S5
MEEKAQETEAAVDTAAEAVSEIKGEAWSPEGSGLVEAEALQDTDTSAAAGGGGRDRGGRKRGRDRHGRRDRDRDDGPKDDYVEKLVKLNRTAKVVKGGRRFSFSALTVIGDKKGSVGYGFGKANDVSEAIRKSVEKAKRNMITLPIKNGTIPHEIIGEFKASRVLLKPACSGTGIIAGGPVRAIMEAGGITDVLSKSLGASSQYNVVKAAFEGIGRMMDARKTAHNRCRPLKDMWG